MPLAPWAAVRPPVVLGELLVLVEPAGDVGVSEYRWECQETLEYAVVVLNVGCPTQREEDATEVLEALGGRARVEEHPSGLGIVPVVEDLGPRTDAVHHRDLLYHGQVPDKRKEVVLHRLVAYHAPEVFVGEGVWHGVVHADLVPDGGEVYLVGQSCLLQETHVGHRHAAHNLREDGGREERKCVSWKLLQVADHVEEALLF